MPKSKLEKQQLIEQYKDKLSSGNAVIMIRPHGIAANEAVEFKKALSTIGAEFRVVKNTLFKLALEQSDLPVMDDLAAGENAVVFCGTDVAQTAKLVDEYGKKFTDKIETGVGILEGNLLSKAQVKELVDMPSLEVIISQIAGILTMPIGGVANVLEDSVRSIAFVVGEAFAEN